MSAQERPQTVVNSDHEDLKAATVSETEVFASSDSEGSDNEKTVDDEPSSWIVSSPYLDEAHQLDLGTVSHDVAAFARALTAMKAVRGDYATAPYELAFNWDALVTSYMQQYSAHEADQDPQLRLFVIVFRSRLKAGADRPLLGRLDKAAHLEAIEAGGLLKYWFGSPDHNRRNLATCLWRARSDAKLGGAGPGHAAAMIAARQMYDEWYVERLELIVDRTQGSWRFGPWLDPA